MNDSDHLNARLLACAQHGLYAEAEKALLDGADVNARDDYQWTPLIWAAAGGHTGVAHLLVKHGADTD